MKALGIQENDIQTEGVIQSKGGAAKKAAAAGGGGSAAAAKKEEKRKEFIAGLEPVRPERIRLAHCSIYKKRAIEIGMIFFSNK